jgi:hypothetical protein
MFHGINSTCSSLWLLRRLFLRKTTVSFNGKHQRTGLELEYYDYIPSHGLGVCAQYAASTRMVSFSAVRVSGLGAILVKFRSKKNHYD